MNTVRRYNKQAQVIDIVHATTTRLGDNIYLSFKGLEDTYSFEIPVTEWQRITRVKRPLSTVRNFFKSGGEKDASTDDNSRIGYSTG